MKVLLNTRYLRYTSPDSTNGWLAIRHVQRNNTMQRHEIKHYDRHSLSAATRLSPEQTTRLVSERPTLQELHPWLRGSIPTPLHVLDKPACMAFSRCVCEDPETVVYSSACGLSPHEAVAIQLQKAAGDTVSPDDLPEAQASMALFGVPVCYVLYESDITDRAVFYVEAQDNGIWEKQVEELNTFVRDNLEELRK